MNEKIFHQRFYQNSLFLENIRISDSFEKINTNNNIEMQTYGTLLSEFFYKITERL